MRFDSPGFRRDALIRLGIIYLEMIGLGAAFAVCLAGPAAADAVPFACSILPGEEIASIQMTNSLASDASCIVSCRFSTTKYDNNPQITCAKAVPAGKEVEMCRLGRRQIRETGRGKRGLSGTVEPE
jgi:hypothetical protein